MPDQKNIILAIAISLAIIVGFEFIAPKFMGTPAPTEQAATTPAAGATPAAPAAQPATAGSAPAPAAPNAAGVQASAAASGPKSRDQAIAVDQRVSIETPQVMGSIRLKGALLDDLTLVNYHETPDTSSPRIALLSPLGSDKPYYAQFGWSAPTGSNIVVPGPETVWQADSEVLKPGSPVMLLWSNGQGLIFKRTIAVDENFMFTVTDSVENTTSSPITLYPYGMIVRAYRPVTENFYVLHEGMLGVFDGTLKELKYDDLKKQTLEDKTGFSAKSSGGWLGITDKYWLTALDLDNKTESTAHFSYAGDGATINNYQADFLGQPQTVAPGQSAVTKTDFFAGAKQVSLLDDYAERYEIDRFDLAIDFGWFYFLTKPFFYGLKFLHGVLGNFGLAILAFTVCLRLLMFPLANKSFKSMSKMKKLQPQLKELQAKYADDKVRLQQEMMALYKKEGANPVAGCLPVVIQIPIFFSLYKVLFVSIEMRHAPFFGWIHDLSAPDPTTLFNLFGLLPFDPPSFLHIGVWPLIMGITMFVQQKLNPAPTDPVQARIMGLLPLVFTFMLATFPAGLVIYWAWNNTLSSLQQWVIMRRMGVSA